MTPEHQKVVIDLKRELYMKRIEAQDGFVSEVKPIVYNHNVFKRIKIAMSDEEIKAEEAAARIIDGDNLPDLSTELGNLDPAQLAQDAINNAA